MKDMKIWEREIYGLLVTLEGLLIILTFGLYVPKWSFKWLTERAFKRFDEEYND